MNSSNFNKFRVLLSVMPLNCLLQVRLNLLDIPLTDVYSWNTGTAIFSPNMNSFINFLFFTWCLLMASYLFSNIRIWHNWSVCVCVCVCVWSHFSRVLLLVTLVPPGSSVHGISQARILKWVAISFSRESSWSRDQTFISYISCIDRRVLYH